MEKMYVIEKNHPFYVVLKILAFLRIVSFEKQGWFGYVQFFLLHFPACVFLLISVGYHFLNVIKGYMTEIDISEDIFVLAGGSCAVLTNMFFVLMHKEWLEFLHELADFQKFGPPVNSTKIVKRFNLPAKIIVVACVLFSISYGFAVHQESPKCYETKEKLHLDLLVCGMYLPTWLPFHLPNHLVMVVYVIQFITVCVSLTGIMMLIFLFWQAVEVIGFHIENLNKWFKNILIDPNVACQKRRLKLWIEYHKHIIYMISHLSSLAKRSGSHAVYISSMVLGFGLYYAQKSTTIKGIACVLMWVAALFLICHAGQIISDKSCSILDNLFDTDWYNAPESVKKDMLLIIMKAQQLGYIEMFRSEIANYDFFVRIIQASYSYLTLLRNTASR